VLTIKVEGLTKLNRELRAISTKLPRELTKVSKDAAEVVADEARVIVPVLTGRLRNSIRPGATQRGALVRAGRGIVYGRVIHFGWPRHNIRPQPFLYDALDKRRDEVIARFEKGVTELVEKSVRSGAY
jgi:hypothetical protein